MDAEGNSSPIVSQTIHVVDSTPPVLGAAGPDATIACPATPAFTAPTATDGCDPAPVVLEVGDVTVPGACAGSYTRTKTWRARDCSGNLSVPVSQTITVDDPTPPSAEITAPANGTVVAAGTPVTFKGIVAITAVCRALTGSSTTSSSRQAPLAPVDWSPRPTRSRSRACIRSSSRPRTRAATRPRIRRPRMGSTGRSLSTTRTAGFVTGGGWIESPPGAYRPNVALEGKANFGFVSKYQKGAKGADRRDRVPVQGRQPELPQHAYEWLVVAGAQGAVQGRGKINGSGDYGFMLTGDRRQAAGRRRPRPVPDQDLGQGDERRRLRQPVRSGRGLRRLDGPGRRLDRGPLRQGRDDER